MFALEGDEGLEGRFILLDVFGDVVLASVFDFGVVLQELVLLYVELLLDDDGRYDFFSIRLDFLLSLLLFDLIARVLIALLFFVFLLS